VEGRSARGRRCPLEEWEADARNTPICGTQIVGKIRLALSPYLNHWWPGAIYVTARGPHHLAHPLSRTRRFRDPVRFHCA